MSLAEFVAAVDGWNKCHGPEQKPEAPTDDQFDAWVAQWDEGKLNG